MYVPFDSLDDSARVWIYQAGRKLTESEKKTISETLSAFTHQWVAHGNPLKTSFKIFHDQFIVLAADENFEQASGCSIDGAVRTIQQIDNTFKLNLFDRTQVAFLNDSVTVIRQSDLLKSLESGAWKSNTLTFNNVLVSKADLTTKWVVPAGETWLKRYLPTVRQA
ncbi:MAG TPA: hypothetical protein VFU05_18380 [Cyclobacteriaceae bacterium]|nr:hypothetical protein [Cyclobacteriaceae bacterium]